MNKQMNKQTKYRHLKHCIYLHTYLLRCVRACMLRVCVRARERGHACAFCVFFFFFFFFFFLLLLFFAFLFFFFVFSRFTVFISSFIYMF